MNNKYAVIAAIDDEYGFSKDGKLPWYFPEDFRWFKKLTIGHPCVMGKQTYLDINERTKHLTDNTVLPNRPCYIISNTLKQDDTKGTILPTFDKQTLDFFTGDDEQVFLIGGGRIFNEGLRFCDTVYLTHIKQKYNCDAFFDMKYVDQYFEIDSVLFGETTELLFTKYKRIIHN